MLEFMRRRARRSRWIKVAFLMIVIVFIFWGVGGSMSGSRSDVVAHVDGQEVSLSEFQRTYENMKAVYREAYKDRLTPEILQTLNLKEQTLEQLINARLLEQEARALGFTVDDEEIRATIAARPEFQEDGQFNHTRYVRALRYLRMAPQEFEERERTQLLSNKLLRLITDAAQVTDEEARALFHRNQEKISLSFIQVASADLVAGITVEKKEIEDFYNTHRESFRQPERVKFVYVAYPAAQFESAVQVSAQQVEEFYTEQKDTRFSIPARIHVRHILFAMSPETVAEERAKIRTTATEILKRAQAGEDFAALAKAYSQDTGTAPNGGDLGSFTRGRMVKPFEEAAFALPAGGVSNLVETIFGLHIIKVESIEPERVRPLAEVQDEIRQELMRAQAQERARDQAAQDREKVQSGAALAEIARASGVTISESSLMGRGETLPGLGSQPTLIEAAFSLTPQQVSEPIAVKDAWYLVSPREKVSSTIPDFTTVATEAEKRCKSDKAEKLAKEKADALLTRLKEAKDLAAVAAAEQLTVGETGFFTRQDSYVPKIGNLPDLKKAAFRLTSEAPVVPQTYLWGGNAFVAVLKERMMPPPQDLEKQKSAIRKELLKRKQAAAMEEFMGILKKRSTITYNHEILLKISS